MDAMKLTMNSTRIALVPAPAEEHPFCFSNDSPLFQQARIGCLRGDFGYTGKLFYTTWFDENAALKTEAFKSELDDVINALRENGMLADRNRMAARCNRFPDAVIKTQWRKEMAFRIETARNIYFMRCIPGKGDYNFYVFCYNKAAFMEALRQQKGLPLVCWSRLRTTNEVIALKYSETGYYKWDTSGHEGISPQQMVDNLNETGSVTKAQVAAMEAGAMFGWHCPASDPRNYDAEGQFRKEVRQLKRSEAER